MDNAFPGNSRSAANERTPNPVDAQQVPESVVQGKVTRRKKSLGKRLHETFFAADAATVARFVLSEVVVPNIKSLLQDAMDAAIDKAFKGNAKRVAHYAARNATSGPTTMVSYNRFATPSPARPTSATSTMSSGVPTARQPADRRDATDLGEIIMENRADAESVIQQLFEDIAQYDKTSVARLIGFMGQQPIPNDFRFGWRNLDDAGVKRVAGGWLLILPPVQDLR